MESMDFHNDFQVVLHATMDDLPPILPKFFVPHLTDKPQNPIMDTLKVSSKTLQPHLPPEVAIISSISDLSLPPRRKDNIWLEAMTRNSGIRVCLIFLVMA